MSVLTPCVESLYYKNKGGYGCCQDPWKPKQRMLHHRLTYMLAHNVTPGDIVGLSVRHKCDNPACINPDHLELGTHADNMKDKADRKRARGGDIRGSKNSMAKLTEDIVRAIRKDAKTAMQVDVAIKYNVTPGTVSYIVNRKIWTHVD